MSNTLSFNQASEIFNQVDQSAKDCGWIRTGLFRNMNGDRCIRARWIKGSGRKERALYLGINVDTGVIVDCRCIINNRSAQIFGDDDYAIATAFLQS